MSPAYAAATAALPMTCLYPGDSVLVANAEQLGTNGKSQAVTLSPTRFGNGPKGFAVELIFAADPVSGEVDVQVADTDVDADYVLMDGGQISLVGGTLVYQGSFQTTKKYVRLKQVGALGAAVNQTFKISRA